MAFEAGAAMGRKVLASWASSSTAAGVAPGQFGGTDSRPSVLACPMPPDTGVPVLPSASPANCGVGYQAPPEPAVVPVPNVSCCAIEALNCPRPTPKYACSVCLRTAVKL